MKMKLILITLTLTALFSGTAINCNTTEPPVNGALTLSLADVSCTEAWIELETNGLTLPANISLLDENDVVQNITLSNSSTTIYIDSLLPNKTYNIQAFIPQGGGHSSNLPETKSNKLSITTLDTTSHNFTWQTWTFGDAGAGGSSLYDIAIIDENNIWAVGEIYMNDSNGIPDPNAYNLAKWNGKEWKLIKVPFLYNGHNFYGPIYSVFAFSESDVWFGIGNMIHWDGQEYLPIEIPTSAWGPHRINKIWGISGNDFYIVGDGGSIAHCSNGQWSKIESPIGSGGMNNNVTDVWGSTMDIGEMVYCVTHDQYGTNNSEIISIQNNKAAITPFNEDEMALSIWTPNTNIIYVGGANGLFKHTNNSWEKINYKNSGYVGKIRGNASNDFFISGGFGLAAHFNGSGWMVYNEISLSTGNYRSVSMKGNIVAFVGYNYGSAVIALGRKN